MCKTFEYTEGSFFNESMCVRVSGDGKRQITAVKALAAEAHFLFANIGGVHAVSRGGFPCEFNFKLLATCLHCMVSLHFPSLVPETSEPLFILTTQDCAQQALTWLPQFKSWSPRAEGRRFLLESGPQRAAGLPVMVGYGLAQEHFSNNQRVLECNAIQKRMLESRSDEDNNGTGWRYIGGHFDASWLAPEWNTNQQHWAASPVIISFASAIMGFRGNCDLHPKFSSVGGDVLALGGASG